MSNHHEATQGSVLHVTITHLIYPVTEKVLGQLFDSYGVNDVCMLQQSTHLEAFLEFQSWHEASKARSALHGRCIYDDCCLLDIQHAPSSISVHRLPNSESIVVDWDQVEVAPPVAASATSDSASSTPLTVHSGDAKESTTLVPDDASSVPSSPPVSPRLPDQLVHHLDPCSPPQTPAPPCPPDPFSGMGFAATDMMLHCHTTQATTLKELASEVFTCIGGLSLFLEPDMGLSVDSADQMLTKVGALSLFIESALDQEHDRIIDSTIPKEEGKLQQFSSQEMQQHGTYGETEELPWDPGKQEVVIKGLFGFQSHAETCVSQCIFCVISRSRKDAKTVQLATYRFLIKVPSWRRSGFSPGYCERPPLEIMPSWMRGGFSPGGFVLAFITDTRMFYSHLWIKGSVVTVNSALFSVTSSMEVNLYSLHIILAKFEKRPVEQSAFCKCVLNVAKAAMLILLTLTLKDASYLIRKLFGLSVSFMNMTQKLYLGNSIQSYEVSACMRAIQSRGDNQPSCCVNSQYAVQLPLYLMLRYQCSIFALWECTSNHMVQVTKNVAYLCWMELLVTYQSDRTFQDHFSLVDKPIAATRFALEVKAAMQRYWPMDPGICSIISGGITKLIAHRATETSCRVSYLGSSLPVSASDLSCVCVIWQYQNFQCNSFFEKEMVHMNLQEAGLGCYCHLQSRLFVFTLYQICNMSTPDGMPWDPGDIIGSKIQAIAWGQAMFCRGGSVTPYISAGSCLSYGLCTWARPGRSSRSRTDKDTQERQRRKKKNRNVETEPAPLV